MRLHSSSLPKLAVFVNLVCIFMILSLKSICCVRLYNDCSSQNIAVDRKGRVYARDDPSQVNQNFTIKSKDFSGKLTIFGEESRRYLCFNKNWKLIGSRKYRGIACLFYEEMLKNGYTRYRSAVTDGNGSRYIGFNKRGKFMKETRQENLTASLRKCLNFLKLDTNFDIDDHNRKVAGLKDNVDITSKLQNIRLHNLTSQSNDLPYVYRTSQHHVKIRHKNHHHQNINEIT